MEEDDWYSPWVHARGISSNDRLGLKRVELMETFVPSASLVISVLRAYARIHARIGHGKCTASSIGLQWLLTQGNRACNKRYQTASRILSWTRQNLLQWILGPFFRILDHQWVLGFEGLWCDGFW